MKRSMKVSLSNPAPAPVTDVVQKLVYRISIWAMNTVGYRGFEWDMTAPEENQLKAIIEEEIATDRALLDETEGDRS